MENSHVDSPLKPPSHDTPRQSSSTPHPRSTSDPDDPQNLKNLLWNATDKALAWLSSATNEQLGACLVGLGASTYLVFGRVGLVFIGVVGGVVLHATWEGSNGNGAVGETRLQESARRREVGIDVAKRLLDWREGKSSAQTSEEDSDALGIDNGAPINAADFSDFKSETASALNDFCEAIVRDYVKFVGRRPVWNIGPDYL